MRGITSEIVGAPVPEASQENAVEAEFVEASAIRRAPQGGTVEQGSARISMELSRWLELDHTLHELYNLVEIAIMQRDEARGASSDAEGRSELLAARLREWKTYARILEERLHTAQIENLELSFAVKRAADIAEEALATPRLFGGRRAKLRDRLAAVGEEL